MGAEDPDGKIIRLYTTDEEHGWSSHPDEGERCDLQSRIDAHAFDR